MYRSGIPDQSECLILCTCVPIPAVAISHPNSSAEIDDCEVLGSGLTVSAMCFFSPTSFSAGFLLVVLHKSVNDMRKLLVNTTEQMQRQGPVTVQVGVGGVYQVTVFPIREGMGILESNVAYTEEVVLDTAGIC